MFSPRASNLPDIETAHNKQFDTVIDWCFSATRIYAFLPHLVDSCEPSVC
jgi:hypothetical protein